MTAPKVCVLILNRDRRQDTLACLESLLPNDYPNLDVVLLDNASSDDSAAAARAAYPQSVTVIETGGNLGYAAGNNVGIDWARAHGADYVLLLNEDTIVARDFITRLVEVSQPRPEVGFLGPLVYHHDEPQLIQSAGGAITPDWRADHLREKQPDGGPDTPPYEVAWG